MSIPPLSLNNGIVQNPVVRKVAGNILGVSSLAVTIAALVDASIPAIDYGYITGPAFAIVGGLLGIFQLTVTSPNVPTPNALADSQIGQTLNYLGLGGATLALANVGAKAAVVQALPAPAPIAPAPIVPAPIVPPTP